jgi:hypothetical protein
MRARKVAARGTAAEATISDWAGTVARGGQVELGLARTRLVGLLLGSLVLVAVGLLIVRSPGSIAERVVGWTDAAFFGLCFVVFVRRLLSRGPRALVDDRGVTLPRAHLEIPWTSIHGSFVVKVARGSSLVQLVVDPNFARDWYATRPAWVRALGRANRAYLRGLETMSLPSPIAAEAELLAEWLDREAEQRNPAAERA